MTPARMIIALFIAAIVAALLSGCVVYRHSRPVCCGHETTSAFTLFKKLDAELIQSRTVDGEYRRTVGAGKIKTAGDAASIEATGNAGGTAARKFLQP